MISNKKTQTNLTTHDFWYSLPEELIAQEPSEPRDMARLMICDRNTGDLQHKLFYNIVDYLHPGDVLVLNDSKVIPARILGIKEDTGIGMEVLLLRQRELDSWEALTRPGRRAKIGTKILFGNGLLRATVTDIVEGGNRILHFEYDHQEGDIYTILDRIGKMPLPPYIKKPLEDNDSYQTIYAKERGSAAAPTAGLHFTAELLDKIRAKGIQVVPVMLHVGLGTFRPVKEEHITDHVMHSEYFRVTEEAAQTINQAKAAGGRIIAVGTTSCRVLESASDESGKIQAMQDDTQIFIYPGYRFKAVDGLITNFHLPESTLLMLVSAFSSKELMMKAYEEAIRQKYRFFSFGDAMFIC
jgi:S-adenosylmethionine:tRNA ribosyltransferase-isomerase